MSSDSLLGLRKWAVSCLLRDFNFQNTVMAAKIDCFYLDRNGEGNGSFKKTHFNLQLMNTAYIPALGQTSSALYGNAILLSRDSHIVHIDTGCIHKDY